MPHFAAPRVSLLSVACLMALFSFFALPHDSAEAQLLCRNRGSRLRLPSCRTPRLRLLRRSCPPPQMAEDVPSPADVGGAEIQTGDSYCPITYLYQIGDDYLYEMQYRCSGSQKGIESFDDWLEEDQLGCNSPSNCKCSCMPSTHSPVNVSETDVATPHSSSTLSLQYHTAAGAQVYVKLFPSATTGYRMIKSTPAVASKSWIGIPADLPTSPRENQIIVMGMPEFVTYPAGSVAPRTQAIRFSIDGGTTFVSGYTIQR